jgi:hypothetical protein
MATNLENIQPKIGGDGSDSFAQSCPVVTPEEMACWRAARTNGTDGGQSGLSAFKGMQDIQIVCAESPSGNARARDLNAGEPGYAATDNQGTDRAPRSEKQEQMQPEQRVRVEEVKDGDTVDKRKFTYKSDFDGSFTTEVTYGPDGKSITGVKLPDGRRIYQDEKGAWQQSGDSPLITKDEKIREVTVDPKTGIVNIATDTSYNKMVHHFHPQGNQVIEFRDREGTLRAVSVFERFPGGVVLPTMQARFTNGVATEITTLDKEVKSVAGKQDTYQISLRVGQDENPVQRAGKLFVDPVTGKAKMFRPNNNSIDLYEMKDR